MAQSPDVDYIATITATVTSMVDNINFSNRLRQDFDKFLHTLCKKRRYYEKKHKVDTSKLSRQHRKCTWNNAVSMQRVYESILKSVVTNDIAEFTEAVKKDMEEWSKQISTRMSRFYAQQKMVCTERLQNFDDGFQNVLCPADNHHDSGTLDESLDTKTYSESMSPISQAPLEVDEFEDPEVKTLPLENSENKKKPTFVIPNSCWHYIFPLEKESKLRQMHIDTFHQLNLETELESLVIIINTAKSCQCDEDFAKLRKFISKTIYRFNTIDGTPNNIGYLISKAKLRELYDLLEACVYRVIINRCRAANLFIKTTLECQLDQPKMCIFHNMFIVFSVKNSSGKPIINVVSKESNGSNPYIGIVNMGPNGFAEPELFIKIKSTSDSVENETTEPAIEQQLQSEFIKSIAMAFQNVDNKLKIPSFDAKTEDPLSNSHNVETLSTQQSQNLKQTLASTSPFNNMPENLTPNQQKPLQSNTCIQPNVQTPDSMFALPNYMPSEQRPILTSSVSESLSDTENPSESFSKASTVALPEDQMAPLPSGLPKTPEDHLMKIPLPLGIPSTDNPSSQSMHFSNPNPQPNNFRKRTVEVIEGPPIKFGANFTLPNPQITMNLPPDVQQFPQTKLAPIMSKQRKMSTQAEFEQSKHRNRDRQQNQQHPKTSSAAATIIHPPKLNAEMFAQQFKQQQQFQTRNTKMAINNFYPMPNPSTLQPMPFDMPWIPTNSQTPMSLQVPPQNPLQMSGQLHSSNPMPAQNPLQFPRQRQPINNALKSDQVFGLLQSSNQRCVKNLVPVPNHNPQSQMHHFDNLSAQQIAMVFNNFQPPAQQQSTLQQTNLNQMTKPNVQSDLFPTVSTQQLQLLNNIINAQQEQIQRTSIENDVYTRVYPVIQQYVRQFPFFDKNL